MSPSEFLLSAVLGACFVVVSVSIVLGVYLGMRRLFNPGAEGDRTHEAANTMAVRIAALHGLILGLVYAQELDDYKGVRTALTEEAVAVADIYNDARRYAGIETAAIQASLAGYLRAVVDEEWDLLGRERRLSPDAWRHWEATYGSLLNLVPVDDRQRFLADRMRHRVTDIARLRQMREATAAGGFSSMFWAPAVAGIVLLSMLFFVYRNSRTNMLLMGLFGAYSGVILFFIYAFANPFEPPGRLDPVPFQRLLEGEIGQGSSSSSQPTEAK